MISLILTLFISMLSIGSFIYKIDETRESGISTFSNINCDSFNSNNLLPKNVAYNGANVFVSFGDMMGSANVSNWFNVLASGETYNDWILRKYTTEEATLGNPNPILPIALNRDTYTFAVSGKETHSYYYDSNRDLHWYSKISKVTFEHLWYSEQYQEFNILFYGVASQSNTVILKVQSKIYFDVVVNGLTLDNFLVDSYSFVGNNATSDFFFVSSYEDSIFDFYAKTAPLSYADGYNYGVIKGEQSGYDNGYSKGYQIGYNTALNEQPYDSTALTIFNGIIGIALVPINMFLKIFNFEILGINLSGFISGILTLAIIVIILRMILGGKKDD